MTNGRVSRGASNATSTHASFPQSYLDNGSGNAALFGADQKGNSNPLNVYHEAMRLFEEYISNRVNFYKVLNKRIEDWHKQYE